MAASLVQTASNSYAGGSNQLTVTLGNTTSGNTLIVFISNFAYIVTNVSDGTNTYTKAVSDIFNDPTYIYYAYNITGASTPTVTITYANSSAGTVVVREYSGLIKTDPLDQTQSNHGSATSATSNSTSTTSQGSELVVGAIGDDSASEIYSAGSGFGHLLQVTGGSVSMSQLAVEDQVQTSTAAYAATFGAASPDTWGCLVATFKAIPPSQQIVGNIIKPIQAGGMSAGVPSN